MSILSKYFYHVAWSPRRYCKYAVTNKPAIVTGTRPKTIPDNKGSTIIEKCLLFFLKNRMKFFSLFGEKDLFFQYLKKGKENSFFPHICFFFQTWSVFLSNFILGIEGLEPSRSKKSTDFQGKVFFFSFSGLCLYLFFFFLSCLFSDFLVLGLLGK